MNLKQSSKRLNGSPNGSNPDFLKKIKISSLRTPGQRKKVFSGSMKSLSNSPYRYPAKVHENKGKSVDPQKDSTDKISYGMNEVLGKGCCSIIAV
jgi:hypothetical protein